MAVRVAGGPFGLVTEGRLGGSAIDDRQRAIGPRQGLLHIRLGVAHQAGQERQRARGDVGVAAMRAIDVRHRRDGRSDEAALPARRAEDEVLELGPAVRLRDDAPGVGVRERVDRDPVTSLASRPAEELPRALGLDRERALEEAEGEPAGLELLLAEEPIGHEQERRRAIAARRVPEATRHGSEERPADAVDEPEAGRDALLACEVVRIGESCAGRRSAPARSHLGRW